MHKIAFVVTGVILVIVAALVILQMQGAAPVVTSPAPGNHEPAAAVVPFEQVARGEHSAVTGRVNYIITSVAELSELWKVAGLTGAPPAVDFSQNQVIAVFGGTEPTAGYSISIARIEDSDQRAVSIALTKPGENCMTAQVITAPYEIVAVPATSLPLTHQDSIVAAPCDERMAPN